MWYMSTERAVDLARRTKGEQKLNRATYFLSLEVRVASHWKLLCAEPSDRDSNPGLYPLWISPTPWWELCITMTLPDRPHSSAIQQIRGTECETPLPTCVFTNWRRNYCSFISPLPGIKKWTETRNSHPSRLFKMQLKGDTSYWSILQLQSFTLPALLSYCETNLPLSLIVVSHVL